MTRAAHNPSSPTTLQALRDEIERGDLDIPVDPDVSMLGKPVKIGALEIPNRFCVQPMEGADAQVDGSPGPLTFRRYQRYARGGFGLVWVEATAVCEEGKSNPAQLHLRAATVSAFARFVEAIRESARQAGHQQIMLVLQLAHAGRYANPEGRAPFRPALYNPEGPVSGQDTAIAGFTDNTLTRMQNAIMNTAELAAEAGFDGVDLKASHGDAVWDLLRADRGRNRYCGAIEVRMQFMLELLERMPGPCAGLVPCCRLDIDPTGGCLDEDNALTLVRAMHDAGMKLLNLGSPGGTDPHETRDPAERDDHDALESLATTADFARRIGQTMPGLAVVIDGTARLRHWLPPVAAGLLKSGAGTFVGMGRGALAYPDAPLDIADQDNMDPDKCCLACDACTELLALGGRTGCVIHDSEIYGPEFRHRHRFSLDFLREEARRCRNCFPAPCSAACPTRIDVPAFLRAFADGDDRGAFEIIRSSNSLPEICSHLCPVRMQCEGACIETTLHGCSIPIQDIQYVVSWMARRDGRTGVRLPDERTGKTLAVVGGGPAGSACAACLLEGGHNVTLFERNELPGGIPHTVIPASRCADATEEIEALLAPAQRTGRLHFHPNHTLGKHGQLEELRERFNAVVLAGGAWQEKTLGRIPGVMDALTFLQQVKEGRITSVPACTAVLAGGDCAMDAAAEARRLGAKMLYVVFNGPMADIHWHMADTWFRTPGVHPLPLTRPLGYETDEGGRCTGIRTCRIKPGPGPDDRTPAPVPESECVLNVDLVIEAMGLEVADTLRQALDELPFSADGFLQTSGDSFNVPGFDNLYAVGALINGGASIAQCVAEGMRAAAEINGAEISTEPEQG